MAKQRPPVKGKSERRASTRRPRASARRQPPPPPGGARRPLVVGIGASAGGLVAFRRFFKNMPADSGLAFVLIQHLDPTHPSLIAELIAPCTSMPALQIEADTAVAADHIYVIPPNRDLRIEGGILRLSTPPPHGVRMPIDVFLESLSRDQRENAIGIVLSGGGRDGTLGLAAIKSRGGLAIVQAPRTAEHDGMPGSAIAAGYCDMVLAPEQMPDVLLNYVRHPDLRDDRPPVPPVKTDDTFDDIAALLRQRLRFDLTPYRRGTVVGRIERRMSLALIENPDEYLRLLHRDPTELSALFKDLLIGGGAFFREPEAWETLEREVLPELVAAKSPGDTVRVWVAGCATGEEAYSLAMLLTEQVHAAPKDVAIQILASDVDAEAVDLARAGLYPESSAIDIPAPRLQRFFARTEHGYRVSRMLRDRIVFAQHNLLTDPPFMRLDLIICRNLLVYLNTEVQKRALAMFRFSLRESGYLFLGAAEGVSADGDLFQAVSEKWRIYRSVGTARRDGDHFPVVPGNGIRPPPAPPHVRPFAHEARHLLARRYAPASVVTDAGGKILLSSGRVDEYLVEAPEADGDLVARTRPELRAGVRAVLHTSKDENRLAVFEGEVQRTEGAFPVRVTVEPLHVPGSREPRRLVLFAETRAAAAGATAVPPARAAVDAADAGAPELDTTLQSVRVSLAEWEATNEALQVACEEALSAHEELQSRHEEVEAAKEDVQCLNETLRAANRALRLKVDALERTSADLDNILMSTNVTSIFLDAELRIRRFTTGSRQVYNLLESDIGRPLSDLASKLRDDKVAAEARASLADLTTRTDEVRTPDGGVLLRSIHPYRTVSNRIVGVLITYSDLASDIINEARLYAESIVDTISEPLLVIESDLRVRSANRSYYATFHATPADTVGRPTALVGDAAELESRLLTALPSMVASWDVERELPALGRRILRLSAQRLKGPKAHNGTLLAINDITERVAGENALRATNEALRGEALFEGAPAGIVIVDARGRMVAANAHMEKLFGYRREEIIGRSVETLLPAAARAGHAELRHAYFGNPETRAMGVGRELRARRKDGTEFAVEVGLGLVHGASGALVAAHVTDVNARKEAEAALRRAHDELEQRVVERTAELRTANEHLADLSRRILTTQDEERRRIGQELHDSTAQMLAGAAMSLAALHKSAPDLPAPARQALDDSTAFIEQASKELRTMSYLMHPPLLDEIGLAAAVQWYAEGLAKRSGLRIDVAVSPHFGRLPASVERAVFRLVQESLNNIHRHARSPSACVEVNREDGTLRLRIQDQGRGIPPDRLRAFDAGDSRIGVGMIGMRERVRQLDGRLEITSTDKGTIVEARIPLTDAADGTVR